MQEFNVLNFPLNGIRLIEASAGTGKTYNLIIIYLRLLLNLVDQTIFPNPLTIKEILVVTFSKSSVQELRTRIKQNIHQFRSNCIKRHSDDYLFSKLLSQIPNINLAIHLLSTALSEIDHASIFTIHGFCQKILTKNTLELNMLFNTSIIENELILHQQICSDFWRRHFYSLPYQIISFIQEIWKNPEILLKDISPYIYKDISQFQYFKYIQESNYDISSYYMQIIHCINNVKKQWINTQHNIIELMNNIPNLNRKIYNQNNLIRWINKINQWSQQKTLDHNIPKNLKYFRSSKFQIHPNNLGHCTIFFILTSVEQLYQRLSSLKALIFNMAIYEIRQNFNITKNIKSTITFNDLINLLLHSDLIKNKENNELVQKIVKSYPIAIIDEFQDTDPNQYKIFHTLYYPNNTKSSLILIGDPKQTVYSFRGADIFSYIKIRKSLNHKYTLNVNWRSSPGMVNAVNQVFRISNPFVFKEIPFIPAIAAHQNNMYRFTINNIPQIPMCFWVHPDSIITIYDYIESMAQECAITLHKLINHIYNETAWLEYNQNFKKKLKESDIIILVRNHTEALIMRSVLLKINISTSFLSNQQNIFETIEAYELLLLLRAILFPEKKTICSALTTVFFNLNANHIYMINNNELQWQQKLEEFYEYYLIWENHDILSIIQKIIFRYEISKKLLSIKSGKNNIDNILYLGEILNNISKKIKNKYNLVKWLELKIIKPQNQDQHELSNFELRLNDNHECIKISTIHKSKGLQFPLTFLPFISNYRTTNDFYFHDRQLFEPIIDFNKSKLHSKLSDEERLSEDLRLLYVAMTRSIYHCSIGIAPIIRKNYKKLCKISDLHLSAIGYLIQNKQPGTSELLHQNLKKLQIYSKGDITYRFISQNLHSFQKINNKIQINQSLSSRLWIPPIHVRDNTWKIVSYSKLKNTDVLPSIQSISQKLLKINFNNNYSTKNTTSTTFTPHTFPKGKIYGTFFHELLRILDFKNFKNEKWIRTQMKRYNIDINWENTIQEWLNIIINTPINREELTLSKIKKKNKQTEFKFNLPIHSLLTSKKLDSLCKHYDSLSLQSPILTFPKTTGMLQGFIDLIFYWNHKYYLLDYKTNWLGENNNSYILSKIEENMIKYRYELQYQLYTVAFNRFLKHRIVSYNYEKNFGGVYYLFIRGMDGTLNSNGVYFCRPSWELIKNLNNLF